MMLTDSCDIRAFVVVFGVLESPFRTCHERQTAIISVHVTRVLILKQNPNVCDGLKIYLLLRCFYFWFFFSFVEASYLYAKVLVFVIISS